MYDLEKREKLVLRNLEFTKEILPLFDSYYKTFLSIPHDSKYHLEDIYTHTLMVVNNIHQIANRDLYLAENYKVLLVAGLLHDLAKPFTKEKNSEGMYSFFNHEIHSMYLSTFFIDKLLEQEYINTNEAKTIMLIINHHSDFLRLSSKKYKKKIRNDVVFDKLLRTFASLDDLSAIKTIKTESRIENFTFDFDKQEYNQKPTKTLNVHIDCSDEFFNKVVGLKMKFEDFSDEEFKKFSEIMDKPKSLGISYNVISVSGKFYNDKLRNRLLNGLEDVEVVFVNHFDIVDITNFDEYKDRKLYLPFENEYNSDKIKQVNKYILYENNEMKWIL